MVILWQYGALLALIFLCIALTLWLISHLYHLALLVEWLEHPIGASIPKGSGIWYEILSKIHNFALNEQRSKKRLKKNLRRFRQAGNILPDGIMIFDNQGQIEWLNPAASRHFSLEGIGLNQNLHTIFREEENLIEYLFDPFNHETYKANLIRNNQKIHPLLLQKISFGRTRQLLLSYDIEEAERVQTIHRDFIANVSHELRTPLTVIGGFLEMFVDMPEMDAVTFKQYLPTMLEQSKRMQALVNDLLTLSRLENQNNEMSMEWIDMHAILKRLANEGESLSQGTHQIKLDIEGPQYLNGNPNELFSAFSNLVTNAIRYTPEAGEITIFWRHHPDGAEFGVSDNGIGIAEKHLSRLTERFYRVDKARARSNGGTGLGLAIVKHILMRHGTVLKIESIENQGSTFSIVFAQRFLQATLDDSE